MTTSHIAITIAHALVGWALCGATMGIGLARTTLKRAVIIHAAAAPMIFGTISFVYFGYFGYAAPLATALIFLGVVIVMDLFVVALLIQKKFDMFKSVFGTWLPLALIFAATYAVGFISGNAGKSGHRDSFLRRRVNCCPITISLSGRAYNPGTSVRSASECA